MNNKLKAQDLIDGAKYISEKFKDIKPEDLAKDIDTQLILDLAEELKGERK